MVANWEGLAALGLVDLFAADGFARPTWLAASLSRGMPRRDTAPAKRHWLARPKVVERGGEPVGRLQRGRQTDTAPGVFILAHRCYNES